MLQKLKALTIIGGGLMGSGIAQVCAANDYKVYLVDQDERILTKAKESIKKSLLKIASKKYSNDKDSGKEFVDRSLQNIVILSDYEKAAQNSGLIIEAIVEDLPAKQNIFQNLDKVAPRDTIFTSNTSSLSVADIARSCQRPNLFAGLHFFNPVPMMKLVEIISIEETEPKVLEALNSFVRSLSKQPVSCKDTPGFIVNRLLVPYLLQAIQMYERGDASKEDIDIAMKLGAGYPMGPFELLDFIGLDTTAFILDGWKRKYPKNELFNAKSNILEDLVKHKKFGRKSGSGFYQYDK